MAVSRTNTNEVLAAARAELQAQLGVVREDLTRLTAEERDLTQALSGLGSAGSASKSRAASQKTTTASTGRRSARGSSRRRRRKRGSSKSTAERLQELQGLLAGGPRSRNDLAAALEVSPPRVQQLLAELGSAVSSEPDPKRGQVKLWSLTGRANGGSAARTARGKSRSKAAATR